MNGVFTQFTGIRGLRSFVACLLCLVLISACGGPEAGSEEQLRLWVSEVQGAAQEKQRRALISMISPAYADARGNDRADIENLLRVYFLRQNNIKLLNSIEDIRIYADTAAEIEITVGMAGTNEGVFGFSADAYRFELELERDGNDWLLISARWGELGEDIS